MGWKVTKIQSVYRVELQNRGDNAEVTTPWGLIFVELTGRVTVVLDRTVKLTELETIVNEFKREHVQGERLEYDAECIFVLGRGTEMPSVEPQ